MTIEVHPEKMTHISSSAFMEQPLGDKSLVETWALVDLKARDSMAMT